MCTSHEDSDSYVLHVHMHVPGRLRILPWEECPAARLQNIQWDLTEGTDE